MASENDETNTNLESTVEEDDAVMHSPKSSLLQDITPKKDGGVLKTLVKPGDTEGGHPFPGSKVYVHYVGRLLDGEKFDSSRDRNEIFHFQLGKRAVIQGWDLGIATMHKNEICELKIRADYGYGEDGFPPKIPENATLIFEVELIGWDHEDITEDGGVMKQILKEGMTLNQPNRDAKVKVHLRGSCEGRLFDERDVEFLIGHGYKYDIVDGVELAICKMKRYEKARVIIQSKYAFGEQGSEKFDIPPNSEIVYEICLFQFEKALELYEMNYLERIENSSTLKEWAAQCIKDGQYKKAIAYYDRILQYVRINKEDSDYVLGLPFKIAAHGNSALCFLKLKDYLNVEKKCEKVLKLDVNNVKANFRYGEALAGMNDYERAVEYYEKALSLEPSNTAVKKRHDYAKLMLKKQVEKEKKLYGNMFSLN